MIYGLGVQRKGKEYPLDFQISPTYVLFGCLISKKDLLKLTVASSLSCFKRNILALNYSMFDHLLTIDCLLTSDFVTKYRLVAH